nr:copia protein [Tanacetum cinerariifolium]
KSMNYVPVVDVGTHSTNFSDTKVDASKDEKKDVSSLRYIVLPNWGHEEHLESTSSQPQKTPSLDNILTLTNQFEDILGDTSNSEEWVRPIGTKWVLKNKKDERGIVIRNKAKLVAQGHTQEERIDYDEVFTLVARIEAIRLFLAYASFMGFIVYQMDVKSAFLYGTIAEEVYVMQPPRFQDPEYLTRVCKVEKAMYGLHQAPRA